MLAHCEKRLFSHPLPTFLDPFFVRGTVSERGVLYHVHVPCAWGGLARRAGLARATHVSAAG